jgi:hypothetical protein
MGQRIDIATMHSAMVTICMVRLSSTRKYQIFSGRK